MNDTLLKFVDGKGTFVATIKLSDNIDFEPKTGYLYCKNAVFGNVGIQDYMDYELNLGTQRSVVKVHRMANDIFDTDSLNTLKGKPVTLEHPDEFVNSNNAKYLVKGSVLTVWQEDENMVGDIVIYDKELIDLVAPEDENGNRSINPEFRDLSLGYNAELVPIVHGKEYKQENIVYNHLAVVRAGRAKNATIRDSEKELKGEKKMGAFAWFKGKKVTKNTETNETIVTDEDIDIQVPFEDVARVISEEMSHNIYKRENWDDPTKTVTTETVTKTVTTEDDGKPEVTNLFDKEKEEKPMAKDKAFFDSAIKEANALPESQYKQDTLAQLFKDYELAFPKPVNVTDSKEVKIEVVDNTTKEIKDTKQPVIDYEALEKESIEYYDKLTNPESGKHKDYKEYKEFYQSEVRSGRR